MSNNGIILAFKAEAVLGEDAEIFQRIVALRQSMTYASGGQVRSFEDYFTILREAVDGIPKLELETDVIPGTENQYSLEMATTMEQIVDDSDRVMRKLAHFQGRLRDGERTVANLKSEFVAWYMLVAGQLLAGLEDVKLPLKELRNLGEAEFSRLMGNIDVRISTMLDDLQIEFDRVSSHKSAQREKHSLGKDQVNASWTSVLPSYGGAIAPEASSRTKPQDQEEELDDEAPQFISRKPSISAMQQRLNQAKPGDTVVVRQTENVAPKIAAIEDVGPSGDCNLTEIKGTFAKTGDPKPITPVVTDTPVTPRKRLIFDDDDGDVI